jgi:hypothetical protein
LVDQVLIPTKENIPLETRRSITDSISFLALSEGAILPAWFDRDLNHGDKFEARLGFSQTYKYEQLNYPTRQWVRLTLPSEPIFVSGYDFAIYLDTVDHLGGEGMASVKGKKGPYTLSWAFKGGDGFPILKVEKEGVVFIETNFQEHVNKLKSQYLGENEKNKKAALKDMMYKISTDELGLLVIFNHIEFSMTQEHDEYHHLVQLRSLYFKEK